jgi:hypothetical protein
MDNMKPFEYGMLYPKSMKDSWVGGYLNNPDNFNKNFVQRIRTYNPNVSISQPVEGEPGSIESLRMANGDNNVFPTLQMKNGALQRLGANERPQETIQTSTPEQAEVLAWNQYKRLNPNFGNIK